ncbi:CHRD domain-containing protein [Halostella sp. JP-L12]|uniref:5'-nucleotidase C-terminal domain-containing protein n=1 Tax=Halostella TaxID=1843185 RepID=UPI0013CED853|nr:MULTISPECIES: 5'-nucleotidase C-terminal domain-containing protein [Halostella]NHN46511.1 CHRD domain-containing protein [Halostella sp. JP-L12]
MGNETTESAGPSQARRPFLKALGTGVVTGFTAGPVAADSGKENGDDKRKTFVASCSGDEEVPPVDTEATGTGTFKLRKGGSELQYKLTVANITDAVAAHIHYEVAGENGPVIVGLYGGSTTGRTQGVLAEGTITDDDLTGPFSGRTVADLVDAIRAGNTYVNVHTEAHPAGEIRGQIGEQATDARTVPDEQKDGQVTLIHDTHFHGRFENSFEEQQNIANYFGLMNRLDAENVGSMKVGNGDDLASSVLSSFFEGEHMTDAFNAGGLRYDTYGNHDFDLGPDITRDRVADSEFTWLSANLLDERTGDVFAKDQGARRYILDQVGDLLVGVTGVINEEAPDITNLGENATVQDVKPALREVVPQMRADGADVVVVLSHLSSPVMEDVLADLDDVAIDAVVGDHAAQVFEEPKVINGTVFSAVGDQFEFVGELTLDVEAGEVSDHDFTLHDLTAAVEDGLEPDPAVAEIKEEYESRLEDLDEVIGTTEVPLDTREAVVRTEEANTGNYIADKMREFADADAALMNGGGIRTDTRYFPDASPESPADVSKLLVFNVLPFGNTVVKLRVTGAAIRAALENGVSRVEDLAGRFPQVGGLSYTWDPDADAGNRIVDVTIGGESLDDSATYTLATNNFVAGGGDGYEMLTDAERLIDENGGPLLAQLIVDSIAAESPIAPAVEGRITELDSDTSGAASLRLPTQ